MEIINSYCALIAPAACAYDAPLESNPLRIFLKFRRVL